MSNYQENLDNVEAVSDEEIRGGQEPKDSLLSEEEQDEIVTAVLLIKNKQGAILPITNLENLKMERPANAHEVMRMCADVQDQISAIRIVGELAQIFDNINKRSLKQVADLLSNKVDNDLGV